MHLTVYQYTVAHSCFMVQLCSVISQPATVGGLRFKSIFCCRCSIAFATTEVMTKSGVSSGT